MTVPFFHSQTYCVMIPAKDAHVLSVASLEEQQAPLPASALCTITLQAPAHRERCPFSPEVSQPNPAVPRYSWERQIGP